MGTWSRCRVDQALAVGALRGARDPDAEPAAPLPQGEKGEGQSNRPGWEFLVIRLERALLKKEPGRCRSRTERFAKADRGITEAEVTTNVYRLILG